MLTVYNAIVGSDKLFDYFMKNNVQIDDMCDYTRYPLGYNFTPCLTATKLEYFLHTMYMSGMCEIDKIEEIYKDMTSSKRMNRMLQGDVGSGKTIVAVIAAYINHLSKNQTALMAPTEVLAKQHFDDLTKLLSDNHLDIAFVQLRTIQAQDHSGICRSRVVWDSMTATQHNCINFVNTTSCALC